MSSKADIRRYQRIGTIGCLACRRYGYFGVLGDVHHLNLGSHAGQKRLGNDHTIGLCSWHHRGLTGGQSHDWWELQVGPSLAHEPKKFREVFGTDEELLAEQNRLIAALELQVVGSVAYSPWRGWPVSMTGRRMPRSPRGRSLARQTRCSHE